MNILLWVLQVLVAVYCIMGAVWRFTNFDQAKKVPSIKAFPRWVWNVIGVFEIVCSLGLVLPGALSYRADVIGCVATALAVEQFLISALHVKHFGFKLKATNPAVWTFVLCLLVAFVAFGRTELHPLG